MRIPDLTSPGPGNQDEAAEATRENRGSTSDGHPAWARPVPGTELRSSARGHGSAGAPLTHELDHESPGGPRRPPESSAPSSGGSFPAPTRRAFRLPAGAAVARAGAVACYAAVTVLVSVAALLGLPLQAEAQTVQTLVSNASETRAANSANARATSFTTGSNAGGYTITEIQLWIADTSLATRDLSVKLLEDDNGDPGTLVAAFTEPTTRTGDALNTFTAPAGTTFRSRRTRPTG